MNPTARHLEQTAKTSLRANPSDSLRHYRRKVTHRRARSGFMEVATRAPVDNFTPQISQPS
jgi:hypothetical protein